MTRYIDADALIENLEGSKITADKNALTDLRTMWQLLCTLVVEAIESEPTADVVEVAKTSTDLISRADAIEAVRNICNTPCNEYFVNALKELPSAEAEWIPVSERLPDNPKDVLTTLSNGMVCIGRHHSFDKWTFEATSIMAAFPEETVIAWMPLPEPYREGGETE